MLDVMEKPTLYTPKIRWDEIDAIIRERQRADATLIRQMQLVRDRTEGDYIIPFGNVAGSPKLKPPVAQLMTDAIEGNAMRAGSTYPAINTPALDMTSELSVKRAGKRRKFVYGMLDESAFSLVARRAFRQYGGYGTFCLVVEWDSETDKPRIELRDALYTYPEPQSPEEYRAPANCAWIYGRSASWLKKMWGTDYNIGRKVTALCDSLYGADSIIDVVEWIDKNERVIGVIGARNDRMQVNSTGSYSHSFEIGRWPNHSGIVPVATGKRVTLSRISSAVAPSIPALDMYERLSTLEAIAIERSVMPDKLLVGKDGMPPVLVNGKWFAGSTGKINLAQNVSGVEILNHAPSQMVSDKVRRIEQDFAKSSGNAGLMSGSYGSEMRSASVAGAVGSFAIDPRIQEMQEVMQFAARTIISAGIDMAHTCGDSKKKHYYFSGSQTDNARIEVDFQRDLETNLVAVEYPMPGSDIGSLTISVLQAVGAGMLSKKTGRKMLSFVRDDEYEEMQVTLELLQNAQRESVAAQAQQGVIPPGDFAWLSKIIKGGVELDDALIQLERKVQERQATAAPPADPSLGQVAAPEEMPGLGMPGMGMEQPSADQLAAAQAPVQGPADGSVNARALMQAMRTPPGTQALPVGA